MSSDVRNGAVNAFPDAALCADLGTRDIHLWLIALDQPVASLARWRELLSADERAREADFRFAVDQRRFAVSHAALRMILCGYTKTHPQDIRFDQGTFGKPALKVEDNPDQLCFNLSHSRGLGLFGVCRGRSLGVDVEYRDPARASDELSRRYFAQEEIANLGAFSGTARVRLFFQTWVRKEAYIKGRGEGLSLGLGTFAVAAPPGQPPRLLGSAHETSLHCWQLRDVDLHPDYAAAFALQGNDDFKARLYHFDPHRMGSALDHCEKVFPLLSY